MERAIRVDIAPGELIDKLTILEIKRERIRDARKLAHVEREFATLRAAQDEGLEASDRLEALRRDLREVNARLWDIEDDLRDCERRGDFGAGFVELARAVYRFNDQRARLKREINEWLGSSLIEEKSYKAY